tara:strand:+ start:505 stop:876 length:372 start_codon:yes stop_codon:yes gene_type:complete
VKELKKRITFEEWSEENSQELDCIFAETGADRELCFNRENEELLIFNKQTKMNQDINNSFTKEELEYINKFDVIDPITLIVGEDIKTSRELLIDDLMYKAQLSREKATETAIEIERLENELPC